MGRFLIGHIFSCNAPLCGRLFSCMMHPIPYLRCFDTPLCIGRWYSPKRHPESPHFLYPLIHSSPTNLRRRLARLGHILWTWAYRADTACRMSLALCQPRTFQHSKSGCCLLYISGSALCFQGVPRQCFGALNWLEQRYNGLEKHEPGVSTSSIRTTVAGAVDSSSPNSNLVSAMMIPRSAA